MPKSMDRTGRGLVCAPSAWASPATLSSAAAAPASPGTSARLPFAERFHLTRHGGIARAADSSLTRGAGTRGAARGCATARKGGAGADGRHFGRESARQPAARNTLGPDSDVFGRRPALRCGGDRLTFRFSARKPGYLLGALSVRTDTRR